MADEMKKAILHLAGATTAAADQAQAMTDAELAERLLTGRWTTIEVHEAGRRLAAARGREEKLREALQALKERWTEDSESWSWAQKKADAALSEGEG